MRAKLTNLAREPRQTVRKILGIIPARYASTRFPGKPLALIHGQSMLSRVIAQAKKAKSLSGVIVATDDQRIYDHAVKSGAKAIMTSAQHSSGTDRCQEAYQLNGEEYDYILNIQGDEPFLDPNQIDELCEACDGKAEIATQMIHCHSQQVLFDKGEVKIVLNSKSEALYFSRSPIPFLNNFPEREWHLHHRYFRHVGMYAYRRDVLKVISGLAPSPLEKAESLEQLRWLENGHSIRCVETSYDSHCVDRPEDISRLEQMYKSVS
jgi:3-deoxy-manno-octulosonate cytidylyltransferase (CMP-KDO synthetase)